MEQSPKNEIQSFNETVPEMSTLLEINGAQLDTVVGGYVGPIVECPLKMIDPWPV
jgi:hypothetical protein